MKKIWNTLDNLICMYIGLDKQAIQPSHLKMIGNQILISNTESYKRHQHTQKIEDFFRDNLTTLDVSHKKMLGMALGKLLATNLIVSFDNISIKRDKLSA